MKKSIFYSFLLIIVVRIAVLLIVHHWSLSIGREGLSPLALGGDDGEYYYDTALLIAGGQDAHLTNGYPIFLGTLMRLTGITDILFYKFLNCLAGCTTVAIAVGVFRAILKNSKFASGSSAAKTKATAIIILLVGLYPGALWIVSGSLYRDASIYLLHLLEVYIGFRMFGERRRRYRLFWMLLGIALLVPLFALRWYAAVSVVLGMSAWLVYRLRSQMTGGRGVVATLVLLTVLGSGVIVWARFSGCAPGMENYERYYTYRSNAMSREGTSNLHIDLPNASIQTVIPLFCYSFLSNALGPLPWQIEGTNMLAAFAIEVPLLSIVAIGIWRRRRYMDGAAWYLLLHAVVWLALISFSNDNIGTALRLRVLGWNILFILYGYLIFLTAKGRARASARLFPTELNRSRITETEGARA